MKGPHLCQLTEDPEEFPPVARALQNPNGLLAIGGDLSVTRLLAAYRRGIFPWYSPGQPVLWWSPDPRTVLFPDAFVARRSLRQSIRKNGYALRINSAFAAVIAACGDARHRPDGTWITPQMMQAYVALHEAGYAYSYETWANDELVGGLYGVRLGAVFFGESMFSRRTDASKFALSKLCGHLLSEGGRMIDCQMATPHLLSLGATQIARADFVGRLASWVS